LLIDSGERAFPRDLESALALPGIGEYTAAAVLSIAYGLPHAAVDGNVARVLSRLARLEHPRDALAVARELLARRRPGDWNQALMELGQTVCVPARPLCAGCPLAAHCRARSAGEVERFPAAAKRRSPERVRLQLTLFGDVDGRILLERGAFPYLRHLWLPPIRVADGEGDGTAFRHTIQHRVFDVAVEKSLLSPTALERRARRGAADVETALFSPAELSKIGRSALLSKALGAASSARLVTPDRAR
jgi:A/G-specific adenine glycosylase